MFCKYESCSFRPSVIFFLKVLQTNKRHYLLLMKLQIFTMHLKFFGIADTH